MRFSFGASFRAVFVLATSSVLCGKSAGVCGGSGSQALSALGFSVMRQAPICHLCLCHIFFSVFFGSWPSQTSPYMKESPDLSHPVLSGGASLFMPHVPASPECTSSCSLRRVMPISASILPNSLIRDVPWIWELFLYVCSGEPSHVIHSLLSPCL